MRYVGIVGDDFSGSKSTNTIGKSLADTAESEDADSVASDSAQLISQHCNFFGSIRPRTSLQCGVLFGNFAGYRKQHRHGVIGDFRCVDAGGVCYADSEFGCGIKIDGIDTHTRASDHLQIWQRFENFTRGVRHSSNEQHIGVFCCRDDFILGRCGYIFDVDSCLADHVHREIARWAVVHRDNDLESHSFSPVVAD